MALPTRNLDDLTYQQLFEILRGDLPPEWSDHNPSDPGIALLELLCWLGEMSLYRMNRVPQAHREKFLKLLLDPPVPVTLNATLELTFPATPGTESGVVLPAGLQFATDYKQGRRTLFESFYRVHLVRPATPGPIEVQLVLRAIRELRDVHLGMGTGLPNQTLPIPIEAEEALLVDQAAPTDDPPPEGGDPLADVPGLQADTEKRGNAPNPRLRVKDKLWQLKSSLRNPESRADSRGAPEHFSVDAFENCVRFGDGQYGAIPESNLPIRLEYAQLLQGSGSLIQARSIKDAVSGTESVLHLLNPESLPAGVTLRVRSHGDAQGGENFFGAGDRMLRGLTEFRDPTRLVTAADFERVALRDFNAFQDRFNEVVGRAPETDKVGRAVALMNRIGVTPSPGHVTLLVLPSSEFAFDPDHPSSPDPKSVTPSEALTSQLLAYLEPRRLIATYVHISGAQFRQISAQIELVIDDQRNATEMLRVVRRGLHEFLSLGAGPSGGGWPIGGAVRRSMLFGLLEAVAGVDHVEKLVLRPAEDGDVVLGPLELPVWNWKDMSIQLRRPDA